MKILIASSSAPDRGAGISTYCREIAEGFTAKGYEIFYASPPPDSFEWLEKNNIKFVSTPFSPAMDKLVWEVLEFIKKNNITAIINNDNAVLQNIAPFFNKTFISVGHLDTTVIASLLGHNIDWVDYTVAISSDMQINLMRKFQLPPYRCPVIHNGIMDRQSAFKRNITNKKIKIVFGGGLIPRKGGDIIKKLLLKASNSKLDNLHFDIFGEIPKGIPTELKNNNNIEFHGKLSHLLYTQKVAEGDIFLLPSRAEGCPMALLEAMCFGLVPITSNGIGAMRWIVTNGKNGFVCDLANWDRQCLQVLEYLSKNHSEVDRLKKESRLSYEEDFKVEYTVTKLEGLLNRPTLEKEKHPKQTKIISWHRWPNSSLIQRINYRLGRLLTYGYYQNED